MPNEKKGDEEHGVRLSYKFRIYPTPSQCEAIKANIDASRFVYNHYLRARMDAYERTQQEVRRPKPACDEQGNVQCDQDGKEIWERTEGGKVVFHTVPNPTYDPAAKAMSMFDTSKDLTRLKKELVDEDGKPWLKEADATALIYALRNLDTAYQNFFRGIKKGQDVGFPKFKSRKNPVQTYKSGNVKLAGCDFDDGKAEAAVAEIPSPIPADWDLSGISWNGIVLPKIGKVRARIHRKMLDGNFAEFNRQLAYKSAWANRTFVEVPGDTPTAQVCSRCGHEELVLARDLRPAWTCPECGAKHDRKANGAQNVLEAGKDILAKQEQSFVTKAKRSREKKRAAKPKNSEKQNDWQL